MDRRLFLMAVGGSSLTTAITEAILNTEGSDSNWNKNNKEKLLRMAEYVIPGTNINKLKITQTDLQNVFSFNPEFTITTKNLFKDFMNRNQCENLSNGTTFKSYSNTVNNNRDSICPRKVSGVVIDIPPNNTDRVISAVKKWEDNLRSSRIDIKSENSITHDHGISRYLTSENPLGYRVQRIRTIGDRMLVTCIEGEFKNEESCFPLVMVQQIENEILLRRVRSYIQYGGSWRR